jgi:hypothetical protein
MPVAAVEEFIARCRAERVAQGLPELVEDPAAFDVVATILDHAQRHAGAA